RCCRYSEHFSQETSRRGVDAHVSTIHLEGRWCVCMCPFHANYRIQGLLHGVLSQAWK
ncbi:unnamed protein product, partial [Gulo gulo]